MVASDGLALLSDFALARALEAGPPHDAAASRSRLAHYVTPEERHARQLGPAADQYGLAVLALECLEAAASPGARPPMPPGVREALTRALSPDPQDRYATVLDLVAALAAGAAPAPASVPQPAAPLARPPVASPVLWDDGYEAGGVEGTGGAGGPRARILRRLALGAALLIALAAAGLTAFRLASPPPEVAAIVVADPPSPHPVDLVPPPDTAPAVVERLAPRPPAQPRRSPPPSVVAAGRLFVGATPWGEVYIDGRLVGHTPMAALPIAAGWHQVRIVRDGFAPFEQRVQVAPGGDVRLTGIVLHVP
jgi:hypothetical protein